MKGIISIFAMPQELEDLSQTLEKLHRNSAFIDSSIKFKIDITMCLSNELTDWESSKLPKEYIKERTQELVDKYTTWCVDINLDFAENDKTLGCVSQRRKSWIENEDADFFIWLDTDMFFRDDTLFYFIWSVNLLKQSGMNMCGIALKLHRVEMTVNASDKRASKWPLALYFKHESFMEKYSAKKQDFNLFVRINHGR